MKINIEFDKEEFNKMTSSELENELLELGRSKYWKTILGYISARLDYADNALRSTDPVEKPTEIARNQGARMGMLDLIGAVELVREKIEKKEV